MAETFSQLFKKFRLKAELATLSQFGVVLAERGLNYESSIFSHWQKGTRIPNRDVLLAMIQIFIDRYAIQSIESANNFLKSAKQPYLTEREIKKYNLKIIVQSPFQIPKQIPHFTGREDIITKITKHISQGNMFLIYGPPGAGKTALTIRIGHLLRHAFPDGVLWYRLDTSDTMDILLSIAYAFEKDISHIQDKEIRASLVRSLLAEKKVLLIFDNAETNNDIQLLLPNSKKCSVIITSVHANISAATEYERIHLEAFTKQEILSLFTKILGQGYIISHTPEILNLAYKVGNLPLAVHILANELKKGYVTITQLLKKVDTETLSLDMFSYEDKNLSLAINLSYDLLDSETKKVFISLGIFNGRDFSIEAVAYINELSDDETKTILHNLKTVSLIEEATKNRYRMHVMIRQFTRKKLDEPTYFLRAAHYYKNLLAKYDRQFLRTYPNMKQLTENVLYIFKKCYELQYWDEVIVLWNPLEMLLDATNQQSKMKNLVQIVKNQKRGINFFQKFLIVFFCFTIGFWIALYLTHLKTSIWNYWWNLVIAIIPFLGGIIGFFIAKSWGLFKSSLGKAIFFISAGLLSWAIGNIIWSYYNFFLNVPVPYPSFADVGYIFSYPLWTLGMISLPHALGGKFGFKKWYGYLSIIFLPVFILFLSYYLLVYITKSDIIFAPFTSWVKLFFDIAYPAWDVIILTTASVLGVSFTFFGGKYRLSTHTILLAFLFMYIFDFFFSYVTTNNTYYNGSFEDLFLIIAFNLLIFGIFGFYFPAPRKNNQKNIKSN